MVLEDSLSNASAGNKKFDDSSSRISNSDDEAADKGEIPEKPKMLTEQEINQKIRDTEGYDESNLFKDEEVDQEGMARIMGLKTEVEV